MLLSFDERLARETVEAPTLPIFDERVCNFLTALSSRLMRSGRAMSDVVTFAYWCRKAALASYAKTYEDDPARLGRGVVFHIAPSNVPVNFAFSLAAGLLAGNKNVVKVPSKEFPQVEVIDREISALLAGDFSDMAPYVRLVRYDRTDKKTTDLLSSICATRVIWGGDATIASVRTSPLPPRANEVTFADRNSLLVVDAAAYLSQDGDAKIAQGFYNDTYFSDQNACTSPRLVVWYGAEDVIELAKRRFWAAVDAHVRNRYAIEAVQAVGKLDALYQSAAHRSTHLASELSDTKTMRAKVDSLDELLMEDRYHSGFFFEYDCCDLAALVPVIDNKIQTVSYVGDEVAHKLHDLVMSQGLVGVDRIVPVGTTMDFSLIWDGYDLIRSMSRVVDLK